MYVDIPKDKMEQCKTFIKTLEDYGEKIDFGANNLD